MIVGYFNNIFASSVTGDLGKIKEILPRKISDEMNHSLTQLPDDAEIKAAAFSINSAKAHRPDGFSAKFYHAYWHIIGPDVIRDIKMFSSLEHSIRGKTKHM